MLLTCKFQYRKRNVFCVFALDIIFLRPFVIRNFEIVLSRYRNPHMITCAASTPVNNWSPDRLAPPWAPSGAYSSVSTTDAALHHAGFWSFCDFLTKVWLGKQPRIFCVAVRSTIFVFWKHCPIWYFRSSLITILILVIPVTWMHC